MNSDASSIDQRKLRVEEAFNRLSLSHIDILDQFYHAKITFKDPLGEHQGLSNLKSYLKKMYQNVLSIRFVFHEHLAQDKSHFLAWTMYLKSGSLESGQEISLAGSSLLRFDQESGKVIYHHDYFDMGSFIYSRIPVLGYLIKKINQRVGQ